MSLFRVTFSGVACDGDGVVIKDPGEVQQILDRILQELLKLNARSPEVISPSDGRVDVAVTIEESDAGHASLGGFALIRTAVHAADISTPGWRVDWVETKTVRSAEGPRPPIEAVTPSTL